jgi:hypothetical protein
LKGEGLVWRMSSTCDHPCDHPRDHPHDCPRDRAAEAEKEDVISTMQKKVDAKEGVTPKGGTTPGGTRIVR